MSPTIKPSRPSRPACPALLAAIALLFPPEAPAELLYFQGGGRAQLPATIRGDEVIVEAPDGPITFRRSDFRKIVPGHWPAKEWPACELAARDGGVEARHAATLWALANGLTDEATSMARSAHASDPTHAPSARMVAALDRLAEPLPDPDLAAVRPGLEALDRTARTSHAILFHRHPDAEAAERLALIEQVIVGYYLTLAADGLQLPPLRHRLASAWFPDRDAYRDYLGSEHAGAFDTTRGYYHPTRDLVAAYDARSDPRQRVARGEIDDRRREVDRLSESIAHLPPRARLKLTLPGTPARSLDRTAALEYRDRLRRQLDWRLLELELERHAYDLGTAAHETVHHLAARTQLAPRHDDFPTWLHEGFASQFESILGQRWAGVGRPHELRLPDFRSIRPSPPLAPLLRDVGFRQGYRRDAYAQAWALTYHLRVDHPQQFLTFLDLLRAPNPTPQPDRTLSAFRSAFPDPTSTQETRWHRAFAHLLTPLEANDPSISPARQRD